MAVQRLGETVQAIRNAYGLPEPDGASIPQDMAEPAEEDADRGVAPTHPPVPGSLPLSREYEVKGITFRHLDIRPPRGVDYWTFGSPYGWHPNTDGRQTFIEYPQILKSYAEWCVKPVDRLTAAEMIDALNMRDTIALKVAVIDFFMVRPASST